jgi:hypothetical protein
MANGIFGDVFDLNNDGNLDSFEQGLEFMFLDELTKDESDDSDNDDF